LSSDSPINPISAPPLETGVEGRRPAPQAAGAKGGRNSAGSLHLWIRRVLVLLFVFLCAVVGVLLIILPWRPEWTDNYFLLGSPGLRAIFASGFVRGLCTGLGALDIWIGFWEAVHYHESH